MRNQTMSTPTPLSTIISNLSVHHTDTSHRTSGLCSTDVTCGPRKPSPQSILCHNNGMHNRFTFSNSSIYWYHRTCTCDTYKGSHLHKIHPNCHISEAGEYTLYCKLSGAIMPSGPTALQFFRLNILELGSTFSFI